MRPRLRALAAVLLTLGLAACGGADPEPTATPVVAEPVAAEPSSEPTPEPDGLYLAATVEYVEWSSSGRILASPDGSTWSVVWEGEGTPSALGISADAAVAAVATGSGSGLLASTDGTTWGPVAEVTDHVTAIAYGNGVWVAVGDRTYAEVGGAGDGSGGAIYRSVDGRSWDRVTTTSPYDNVDLVELSGGFLFQTMESVAHLAGQWVATARECTDATGECLAAFFVSGDDGASWSRVRPERPLGSARLGSDGETWAVTALSGTDAGSLDAVGGQGENPLELTLVDIDPAGVVLGSPHPAPGGWVAAQVPELLPDDDGNATGVTGLWRSADAVTWSTLGEIPAAATAAAYLGLPASSPGPEAASAVGPDRITLGGAGLTAAASGGSVSYAYTAPAAEVLDAVTLVLGDPVVEAVPGDGTCTWDGTAYTWDGLVLRHDGDDPGEPGWWARLVAPAGTAGTAVTGPEGITVGEEMTAVLARLNDPEHEAWDYEGQAWERIVLDVAGERAVVVMAVDGVVTTVSAPVWLDGDC